jgi:hypothetical protein
MTREQAIDEAVRRTVSLSILKQASKVPNPNYVAGHMMDAIRAEFRKIMEAA